MKTVFKYILLVICQFHFGQAFFAQGGWKAKLYLQNSITNVASNIIESPNGDFITVGFALDSASFSNQLAIIGTNQNGIVLWRKNYGNGKFEYLYNLMAPRGAIVQKENFFYYTLGARDSLNNYVGVLLKFNYAGDTIWQKVYRDTFPKDIVPQALSNSIDGGFLMTGYSQNTNTQACIVIKTDSTGQEIWRRRINKSVPDVQDGRSIVQDSASKRIIITGYQYIGNAASFHAYSNVLILDSIGNKIVQKSFNNAGGGGFDVLIQLKDNNFMSGGSWYMGVDNFQAYTYRGFLVKFDINGNEIWNQKYDVTSTVNNVCGLVELPNGDIMMLNALDSSDNCVLGKVDKPEVCRISKEGKVIFKRCIGSANPQDWKSCELPRSFNRTSDKGFIITSQFYKAVNPQPFSIIKIDSMGCDSTENYCREQLEVGFSNIHELVGYTFSIFPNPASRSLTLKLESITSTNFVVSLIDVSGRPLEVKEMCSNHDLNFDVGFYAPGIYFIKIVCENGVSDIRKVVIDR